MYLSLSRVLCNPPVRVALQCHPLHHRAVKACRIGEGDSFDHHLPCLSNLPGSAGISNPLFPLQLCKLSTK